MIKYFSKIFTNKLIIFSKLKIVTYFLVLIWILLVSLGYLSIPISINLGFVDIRLYGLIIGIAIVTVLLLVESHVSDTQKHLLREGLIWVILPAIICARIYHVVTDSHLYVENIFEIFKIWNGGLGIFGAILGGTLGGIFFLKKNNVPILPTMSLVFQYLPIGQSIGRIGNLINQELYGYPTSLFWGQYIREENRIEKFQEYSYFHPVYLYEIVGNIVLFLILNIIFKRIQEKRRWIIIPVYFVGYSIIRFIVEFYRINDKYFGFLSLNQIVCMLIFFSTLIISLSLKKCN